MLKKIILKFLTKNRRNIYVINNSKINKIKKKSFKGQIHNFGNKNKNKTFYVIQREGIGGFFSNLLFVLDHLIICEKLNFIPVIDCKNFPTIYSEKNENSWTYYFEPVSNHTLDEVYESKKVIFSSDLNEKLIRNYDQIRKNHLHVFKKYIRVKKYLVKEAENFLKKNKFKKNEWIGLHWRGNDMKTAPNHPFPPTKNQITKLLDKYTKNKNIFVVVDEVENLSYLKNRYTKIIFFDAFRSSNKKDFYNDKSFYRQRHRFKQGKEIIIQALILSKLETFIGGCSMLSDSIKYLLNRKIKYLRIDNGINSKSLIHSLYLWKLKKHLPQVLGGFKD